MSCLFNLQDKQIALLIIDLLKISECNVIEKWADYTQSLFASQDGTYFLMQVQIRQSLDYYRMLNIFLSGTLSDPNNICQDNE